MSVDVIVGLQRGDEGKGRFVDLLASDYDIVARANGGANAGHTVIPDGRKEHLALHQVPSGVAYPGKLNVIGTGVYLDPRKLIVEIETIKKTGLALDPKTLRISDAAHLVLPHHIILDELRESGEQAQGSTKSGIAFVAGDKYLREGLRVEAVFHRNVMHKHALDGLKRVNDLLPAKQRRSDAELEAETQDWVKAAYSLTEYVADTNELVNQALQNGKRVLVEGAQAYWLDINHGMYPAVTSSSTTVSGLLDGLGLSAKYLGKVTGVVKAVKSHVGGGPLVTEIKDAELANTVRGPLGKNDSEYGVTTKRPRRIGYPDLVELRNAVRVNGIDELAVSKLDHVPRYGDIVPVATSYQYHDQERSSAPSSAFALAECRPNYQELKTWSEPLTEVRSYADLPDTAKQFIELFEKQLGVPVSKIGVGPERSQVILR